MSEQPASLPNGFRDSTGEALLRPDPSPLPEEWRVVRFEDAFVGTAKVPKVKQSDYRYLGTVPVIDQGQEFIAGYIDDIEPYKSPLPVIVFGDHTRIFKYVDFPFAAGADGTKVLIPNRDKFEPRFLFYALIKTEIPSRGYNRHFHLLREKIIPLPPLPEQRAIAHVLTSIQRAIEATEQVIAAARELKKALMRHLFTYGPVPPAEAESVPLQETEIGPLPVHWRVARLGEVFEIQQGKSLSPKSRSGSRMRPFLRTANVFWGKIDTSVLDYMHFEEYEEQRLALKPGDLLVCEGGDIGRTALWDGRIQPCYYQNHLHRLRPIYPNVEPAFYMYWMETAWKLFSLYGGSGNRTTIPNLSQSRLASFAIPFPPLPEQQRIAEMLRTVDEKIQAEENRKTALQSLFRSMLHHLMTGKVRVAGLVTSPTQPEE